MINELLFFVAWSIGCEDIVGFEVVDEVTREILEDGRLIRFVTCSSASIKVGAL